MSKQLQNVLRPKRFAFSTSPDHTPYTITASGATRISFDKKKRRRTAGSCTPCRKCHVTDELYFGTYIVCSYLPFSKAAKGAQCGPQQSETFEQKWEQAVERGHINAMHVILFIHL